MTLYRVKQNKIEAAGNETEQLGKGTQPDDITDIFPEKKNSKSREASFRVPSKSHNEFDI